MISRDFPAYKAYETAVFFQSDWLNEFYDDQQDQKDDYRFIYFGPQDSWWDSKGADYKREHMLMFCIISCTYSNMFIDHNIIFTVT